MHYVVSSHNVSGLTDLKEDKVCDVGTEYRVTVIGNSLSECEELITDNIIERFGTLQGHLSIVECEQLNKAKVLDSQLNGDYIE